MTMMIFALTIARYGAEWIILARHGSAALSKSSAK